MSFYEQHFIFSDYLNQDNLYEHIKQMVTMKF